MSINIEEIRNANTPKWRKGSVVEDENNMKSNNEGMNSNNEIDDRTKKYFEEKYQKLIEKVKVIKIEDLQFVEFKIEALKFEEFKVKDLKIEQFKMEELKILVEMMQIEYDNKKNETIELMGQDSFDSKCRNIDTNPKDYLYDKGKLVRILAEFGVKKFFFENLLNEFNVSLTELMKELGFIQDENDTLRKQNQKLTHDVNNLINQWQDIRVKPNFTDNVNVLSNRLDDYQKEIERLMKIIEELVKIINKNEKCEHEIIINNLQNENNELVKKLSDTEIRIKDLQNEINLLNNVVKMRNEIIDQNNAKIQEFQEIIRTYTLVKRNLEQQLIDLLDNERKVREERERKVREEREQKEREERERKEREEREQKEREERERKEREQKEREERERKERERKEREEEERKTQALKAARCPNPKCGNRGELRCISHASYRARHRRQLFIDIREFVTWEDGKWICGLGHREDMAYCLNCEQEFQAPSA